MLAGAPKWQPILIAASAVLTASGLVLVIIGPRALGFALLAFAQPFNIAIAWQIRSGSPNFFDPQRRPK